MKPEFSSSDLMLALAIVNGTAAAGAEPEAAARDAKAGDTEGKEQAGRGAITAGRASGHGR